MNLKLLTFLIAFTLLAVSTWAQPQRFTLDNAVIHTALGEPFEGYVVVNNGVIESVGRGRAPGSEAIDLGGQHLYPGLIEADSALGLVEVESLRATRDHAEVGHCESQSYRSLRLPCRIGPCLGC